jgi:uncharacterized protein (TIGR02996 family)
MSDEPAFLAAIQAAPADDAPRLVYADWLDEQGRHEQAEMIRVEQTYRRAKARLTALQERVGTAWAMEVFPTYRLILSWYSRGQKIMVIKLIRELLGCGLLEAKQIAEALPARLGPPTPMARLRALETQLQACGAEAEFWFAVV